MSKETPRDQVLGHADEADGIEEYDNPMPGWWLGLFYFTIVWAIGYAVHYHFIAHRSQTTELSAEMASAETRWQQVAVSQAGFAMTDEAVEAGERVFAQNCASCHGQNLQGGIGPNLLDAEWIHGGTPEAVVNTITHGVLERGMLAWETILGAERINQVAAYVLSENAEALGIELPSVGDNDAADGHSGDDAEGDEHGEEGDDD